MLGYSLAYLLVAGTHTLLLDKRLFNTVYVLLMHISILLSYGETVLEGVVIFLKIMQNR